MANVPIQGSSKDQWMEFANTVELIPLSMEKFESIITSIPDKFVPGANKNFLSWIMYKNGTFVWVDKSNESFVKSDTGNQHGIKGYAEWLLDSKKDDRTFAVGEPSNEKNRISNTWFVRHCGYDNFWSFVNLHEMPENVKTEFLKTTPGTFRFEAILGCLAIKKRMKDQECKKVVFKQE
jgi:hypothetical protein